MFINILKYGLHCFFNLLSVSGVIAPEPKNVHKIVCLQPLLWNKWMVVISDFIKNQMDGYYYFNRLNGTEKNIT